MATARETLPHRGEDNLTLTERTPKDLTQSVRGQVPPVVTTTDLSRDERDPTGINALWLVAAKTVGEDICLRETRRATRSVPSWNIARAPSEVSPSRGRRSHDMSAEAVRFLEYRVLDYEGAISSRVIAVVGGMEEAGKPERVSDDQGRRSGCVGQYSSIYLPSVQ